MSRPAFTHSVPGPFRAEQIRSGDPYELSNGHAVYCLPQGGRGASASLAGGVALGSDPAVESAGVDAGFSPSSDLLRAPDLAIGNVPDEPGWIQGVPPLAVEYADTGQDETELQDKIRELLAAGTRILWVVRLTGPRRVEIHVAGEPMRLARPGEQLTAPGILANPLPVEALYDPEASRRVTLRNLLQREGYDSVEAIRDAGREEGRVEGREEGKVEVLRESIREILATREILVGQALAQALERCTDLRTLKLWQRRAITAASAGEILSD